MSKKYNYRDDFETLYLRQEYLARIDYLDPKWVKQNRPIVNTTAIAMFNKLKPNFEMVGFDKNDIISITNVYMLAYMGLYSLETNTNLRQRFVDKFIARCNREPNEVDFIRTERNNMINFLRQRIQHCANICERKSRNIKVGRERHGLYAKTKDSVPAHEELILQDCKKFGYRKVTHAEFNEAKIQSRLNGTQEIFDKYGFAILEIQTLSDGIEKEDYQLLLEDSHHNIYNQGPENMMMDYEDSMELEKHQNKFDSKDNLGKIKTLKFFIRNNKDSIDYKDEIKLAKKIIKELKNVV
jgi:hypothetical protein